MTQRKLNRKYKISVLPVLAILFSSISFLASAMMFDEAEIEQKRYLIYLHPKIIEEQGVSAVSSEYGQFKYQDILDTFTDRGYLVLSDIRERDADSQHYAALTVSKVKALLKEGVEPQNINILGASKGAFIASLVSKKLDEPLVNYVLLAGCHPDVVSFMIREKIYLTGNILTIRDYKDDKFAGSCENIAKISPEIAKFEELIIDVGSGHGIIFSPIKEWVYPAITWFDSQQ